MSVLAPRTLLNKSKLYIFFFRFFFFKSAFLFFLPFNIGATSFW